MRLLENKNAIITGAARGIGKAIATSFYKHGAKVLIADIDEVLAEKTCENINKKDDLRVFFNKTDITAKQSVIKTFKYAIKIFGQVDILVNNAALLIPHYIKDFPLNDWKKIFDVNINGTFICSQIAIKHMIKKGIKGCILNIGSAASRKADAKHAAYSASKAAIVEFARVLALEVGKYSIRVNSVLPGATDTEMLRAVFKKVKGMKEEIIAKTVLGRLGRPEDHANAAVFLCSDMASHITGEYLIVSGGEFFNP